LGCLHWLPPFVQGNKKLRSETPEATKVIAFEPDVWLVYNLSRVDLLKVDIEGAEKEMFANGQFLPRVGNHY
jgi:hypothetical protein